MPSDVLESAPGSPPTGERPPEPGSQRPPGDDSSAERSAIPDPSLGSSSCDDLSLMLTQLRPDPMLGPLDPGPSERGVSESLPPGLIKTDPPSGRSRKAPVSPPRQKGSFDPVTGVGVSTASGSRTGHSGTFTDATEGLGLASSSGTVPALSPAPESGVFPSSSDADDDEPPHRGTPLSMVLLASYASAVTLGLFWVLWTGRHAGRPEDAAASSVAPGRDGGNGSNEADPGRRADRSRRMTPPPPIAADRTTTLGRKIRVGAIEVTPIDVTSRSVLLERTLARHEIKVGGKGVLALRLRIKNVSSDVLLAPLDEAYIRDREGADPETFIETGAPGEAIPMYPLAVESEWAIDGQEFKELRPGEEFDTLLVSVPKAAARVTKDMVWRVRLRTDINRTEDVGVRFRAEDVRGDK